MAHESDGDDLELEGHRGTRASPRIRWFFEKLGFERMPSED